MRCASFLIASCVACASNVVSSISAIQSTACKIVKPLDKRDTVSDSGPLGDVSSCFYGDLALSNGSEDIRLKWLMSERNKKPLVCLKSM